MKSALYGSFSNPFKTVGILMAFLLAPEAVGLADSAQVPAFPGAEGFGKFTKGGRGGDVYRVANLGDSGPGSLRHGIESATAPRTIVFEVCGTIALKSPLPVEEKRYLTIAGQTSPGKGITLRDQNFFIKNCKHIVVRYLRVRLGDENKEQGSGPDVMTVDYNDHVILDHLSLSWGVDSNSDYRGNSNMTLQWLIYSEALNASLHGKGEHAMASSLRLPWQYDRAPQYLFHFTQPASDVGFGCHQGRSELDRRFSKLRELQLGGTTNLGGLKMNVVGNYYRPGPCTQDRSAQPLRMKDHDTTEARGFAHGNFFYSMPEKFNQDNFTAVNYTNIGSYMSTSRQSWELEAEIDCGEFAVPTQSAKDAYESCLKFSGCSLVRDTVDERTIANIVEQKGEIIDSQNDVGGWDRYPTERRPEGWDTDCDGMADAWETAHDLDPKNPQDGHGDADKDGYTNLEEYLNSLCP